MPFQKGCKKTGGKQKGSKNQKTKAWEALSESITGNDADNFRKHMDHLWKTSPHKAAELFLKTLEFFKPKDVAGYGSR